MLNYLLYYKAGYADKKKPKQKQIKRNGYFWTMRQFGYCAFYYNGSIISCWAFKFLWCRSLESMCG